MVDINNKEQAARVEKYAQARLERVHSISSGAKRTAVLWLVALAIWFQQLEPKLGQVREAQISRRVILPASTLGLQSIAVSQHFQDKEILAKQEELELPFSIKFKLRPELVTTLWLALAFGLSAYLLVTRRRLFRLAARGLRILEAEAKAEPPYVRSLVGEAVWWLTPLPRRAGQVLTAETFRRALGWEKNRRWPGFIALSLCIILLLLVETRVFYFGFCVASFLQGILLREKEGVGWWLFITTINCVLFLACLLSVWRWFEPAQVPDLLQGGTTAPTQIASNSILSNRTNCAIT